VQLAAISTNLTQGAAQSTGRSTDFMIQGDGYFVVNTGGQQLYTRAGSFQFDSQGNLTTPDGAIVQGWMAQPDGVVNSNGPITGLKLPFGQTLPPSATGTASVGGNLPAAATVTPPTTVNTSITMYDAEGNAQPITFSFTKTAADTWTVTATDAARNALGSPTTLNFDTSGKLTSGGSFTFNPTVPGWTGPVTVDIGKLTQYGAASSVAATDQDGSAMGTMQSFTLGNDGMITGVFSNGLKQPIGQVALASFNNPGGLQKVGNSEYASGTNSGVPLIGQGGSGGRGTLTAGSLEMSNVDLSQEFTNLIIAQRGFQANSKVITTSDQILNDLVNMKQ
jgi:flagellar hook protein FlgE